MITKESITNIVEQKIEQTDLFLVEVKIDTSNNISVFLDGEQGVSIDKCVEISRFIESNLDRETEDFALEVSSAGIGQPFKVFKQYQKAINKDVEVLLLNGIKREATLLNADENQITISYQVKEKPEGAKRPKMVEKTETLSFDEIKSVTEIIRI